MADSAVDICNRAMSLLGSSERMQTLNDTSPPAALWCGRLYNSSRRQVLSMHPWGFATKTEELAAATDDAGTAITHPVWPCVYAVPEGTLRILFVSCKRSTYPLPFEIENDLLLAADMNVVAKFVFDQQDTTKFNSLFDEALANFLASQASVPAGLGQERMDELMASFYRLMPVASGVDATQASPNPSRNEARASWLEARTGIRSWRT